MKIQYFYRMISLLNKHVLNFFFYFLTLTSSIFLEEDPSNLEKDQLNSPNLEKDQLNSSNHKNENSQTESINWNTYKPWFILGTVVIAVIGSIGAFFYFGGPDPNPKPLNSLTSDEIVSLFERLFEIYVTKQNPDPTVYKRMTFIIHELRRFNQPGVSSQFSYDKVVSILKYIIENAGRGG